MSGASGKLVLLFSASCANDRLSMFWRRFLNMLASLEALMTLGKCRELPVVGFVKGYMLVGVIVSGSFILFDSAGD